MTNPPTTNTQEASPIHHGTEITKFEVPFCDIIPHATQNQHHNSLTLIYHNNAWSSLNNSVINSITCVEHHKRTKTTQIQLIEQLLISRSKNGNDHSQVGLTAHGQWWGKVAGLSRRSSPENAPSSRLPVAGGPWNDGRSNGGPRHTPNAPAAADLLAVCR